MLGDSTRKPTATKIIALPHAKRRGAVFQPPVYALPDEPCSQATGNLTRLQTSHLQAVGMLAIKCHRAGFDKLRNAKPLISSRRIHFVIDLIT